MPTHADRHELLTVKETAFLLRLHPMTVRRMIEQGAIPAVQLNGKGTSIRVDADRLETQLHQASATAAATSSADRSAAPSERDEACTSLLAGNQPPADSVSRRGLNSGRSL